MSENESQPAAKPSELNALLGGDCLICGKPVPDYAPVYCCNEYDCGCMGQPVIPCVCSEDCDGALMSGIGKPFEQRRIDAGIPLWTPNAV